MSNFNQLLKNRVYSDVHMDRLPLEDERNFIKKMENEGYYLVKWICGLGYCGILNFVFTTGICYGLSEISREGRWCYENPKDAMKDFLMLGINRDELEPSGNWVKHKGTVGEWGNINYK